MLNYTMIFIKNTIQQIVPFIDANNITLNNHKNTNNNYQIMCKGRREGFSWDASFWWGRCSNNASQVMINLQVTRRSWRTLTYKWTRPFWPRPPCLAPTVSPNTSVAWNTPQNYKPPNNAPALMGLMLTILALALIPN